MVASSSVCQPNHNYQEYIRLLLLGRIHVLFIQWSYRGCVVTGMLQSVWSELRNWPVCSIYLASIPLAVMHKCNTNIQELLTQGVVPYIPAQGQIQGREQGASSSPPLQLWASHSTQLTSIVYTTCSFIKHTKFCSEVQNFIERSILLPETRRSRQIGGVVCQFWGWPKILHPWLPTGVWVESKDKTLIEQHKWTSWSCDYLAWPLDLTNTGAHNNNEEEEGKGRSAKYLREG